jgi:hypothetical protein
MKSLLAHVLAGRIVLVLSAVALGVLAWPLWVRAQDGSGVSTEAAEMPSDYSASAPEQGAPGKRTTVSPSIEAAKQTKRERKRAKAEDWTGPRVELSYRVYSLRDDQGGRAVNSGGFSGFLPTRKFRGGGGLEAGRRGYEYGSNEGLLSGNVFAGYQHLGDLGRMVPYVVVVGELGVLLGKRFHTPLTRMVRGVGMELGTDVNLVKTLYVGLGVGFMIYTIDDLAYDSWGIRLSIGL